MDPKGTTNPEGALNAALSRAMIAKRLHVDDFAPAFEIVASAKGRHVITFTIAHAVGDTAACDTA
jgi:hypothetical protein